MRAFQVLFIILFGKFLKFSVQVILIIGFILHFLIHILLLPKAPEMLRMPLVELCLQIKLLSLGYIKPFLLKVEGFQVWD